jgi:hypothetical protein
MLEIARAEYLRVCGEVHLESFGRSLERVYALLTRCLEHMARARQAHILVQQAHIQH